MRRQLIGFMEDFLTKFPGVSSVCVAEAVGCAREPALAVPVLLLGYAWPLCQQRRQKVQTRSEQRGGVRTSVPLCARYLLSDGVYGLDLFSA